MFNKKHFKGNEKASNQVKGENLNKQRSTKD